MQALSPLRFPLKLRGLGHSDIGTENPRVGGSIPPLGTEFKMLERRKRFLVLTQWWVSTKADLGTRA
jgi:hypothetical protein